MSGVQAAPSQLPTAQSPERQNEVHYLIGIVEDPGSPEDTQVFPVGGFRCVGRKTPASNPFTFVEVSVPDALSHQVLPHPLPKTRSGSRHGSLAEKCILVCRVPVDG